MATYYVIARMDGTRFISTGAQRIDLAEVLHRGVTQFVPLPGVGDQDTLGSEDDTESGSSSDQRVGLLLYPEPVQAGLGIGDDMTLTLGVDGGFRLFQVQAVPAPESYVPTSEVGAQAIISREFLVPAEVPAWWAYGPCGRRVAGLLTSIAVLDKRRLESIGERVMAQDAAVAAERFNILGLADKVIAETGRIGAARLARNYVRAATYRSWDRSTLLGRAATLAGDIGHVLVVADRLNGAAVESVLAQLAPEIPRVPLAGANVPYGVVDEFDETAHDAVAAD